jgi:hypothetical protein
MPPKGLSVPMHSGRMADPIIPLLPPRSSSANFPSLPVYFASDRLIHPLYCVWRHAFSGSSPAALAAVKPLSEGIPVRCPNPIPSGII